MLLWLQVQKQVCFHGDSRQDFGPRLEDIDPVEKQKSFYDG